MKARNYATASIETMMRKFDAPDLPPKGRFHYHQGVFLSGVYQIYERTGDQRFYDYVKAWVDSCMDMEGNILQFDKGQMDDIQPGILLYHLLKKTGDARYEKALHTLAPLVYNFVHNEDGGLWHKSFRDHQMWLDGLYMGGPICAEYGKTFDHPEYFDFVAKQILLMRDHCKDEATGLWYHAYDDARAQEWADPVTGKSPEFWGRSIGWVPVAILDDLDFIPEDHPKRGEIEDAVRDLLIAITKFQSEDGRWYQVVDKGDRADNWLENSCSCLYVAALIKAVRKGLLDPSYLDSAKKGYEGVIRSLSMEGEDLIVGNVCIGTGVGDYAFYVARPTSENDLHGVGAFLLMCAQAMDIDL
ncbi:MAG: glycoside hydrolase family 88 protein [Lachnospiraceae bacterium]|nr:glycoside hydrolase family 88 protein [Lachnospiraceae bacterium]